MPCQKTKSSGSPLSDRADDVEIIQGIFTQNEKILAKFYKKYHSSLFRFVHRRITDVGAAEELVQDVLFDFIESVRSFRGSSSIKTYLFSIARNKVIDHFRKKQVKQILFSALPSGIVETVATVFNEDLEKKELEQRIQRTLKTLPNDYAVILRLKYIEGAKVIRIAELFCLSLKATESLLFRARKAFTKAFRLTI